MKVIKGNIWDYWKKGNWIVIPTNRTIKKDGSLVMGRGLALQAKNKIKDIDKMLGSLIKINGNNVYYITRNLISFPVKHNWWERANLDLIEESITQLLSLVKIHFIQHIYLPKVGCGNGKLNWKDVEPILDKYLDERFTVVDLT